MAALPDYIVGRSIVTDYLAASRVMLGPRARTSYGVSGRQGDLRRPVLTSISWWPPGFKKPSRRRRRAAQARTSDYHGLTDTSDQGRVLFPFGPQRNGRVMGEVSCVRQAPWGRRARHGDGADP
jgi:hypothetical protein